MNVMSLFLSQKNNKMTNLNNFLLWENVILFDIIVAERGVNIMINLIWNDVNFLQLKDSEKNILTSYGQSFKIDLDTGASSGEGEGISAYKTEFAFEACDSEFILLDFGVIKNITKFDLYLNETLLGDTCCGCIEFKVIVPQKLLSENNSLILVVKEGASRDIWMNGVPHKYFPEGFVSLENELPGAVGIFASPENRSIKFVSKDRNTLNVLFLDGKELLLRFFEKDVARITLNPDDSRLVDKYCLEDNLNTYSDFNCSTDKDKVVVTLTKTVIEIYPHRILYKDNNGNIYSEISLVCEENNCSGISVKLDRDEAIFALGENAVNGFNKRGTREDIWVIHDFFRCDVVVPFFFSNKRYGFYLNSSYHSIFDMGMLDKDNAIIYTMEKTLDFFLFADDKPKNLVNRFCEITGKPALPPKWAFGFWQAGMKVLSEKDATETIEIFNDKNIPIDVIGIDPPWQNNYNDFRWNEKLFPNYKNFTKYLKDNDVHLILWSSPFVNKDCDNYNEGVSKTAFMIDESGKPINAVWWKGYESGLINYFDKNTVNWLSERINQLIDDGADGMKVDGGDGGEVPCTAKTPDGRYGSEFHNLYPVAFAKETQNILLKKSPDKRPVTWERTGFTGSGKYPCTWGGDQFADFSGMQALIKGGQMCSLVGIPFWSQDVGGFCLTDKTTEEFFIRSYQWGLLSPLSRAHGQKTRPWDYSDKACDVAAECIRNRYKLLVYLYSLAYSAVNLEENIMYPVFLDNIDDKNTYRAHYQYMLGKYMMVAPIFEESGSEDLTATRKVYFPEGNWYDIRNWEKISGCTEKEIKATIEQIPVFYKDGAIIPAISDIRRATDISLENLEITVIPSNVESSFKLYDDAGEGFEYKNGNFCRIEILQYENEIQIKTLNDSYLKGKEFSWTFKILTEYDKILVNGKEISSERNGKFSVFKICYKVGENFSVKLEG